MSAENLVQERTQKVMQAATEPSYLSEIARKLDNAFPGEAWNVEIVIQAASTLTDQGRVEVTEVGYEGTDGQPIGSMHTSSDPQEGTVETKNWNPYTIIHWEEGDLGDVEPEIAEFIEPAVTVDQKAQVVRAISGDGNIISQQAEEIMQSEMSRQFRRYNVTRTPEYNDPGLDFAVVDQNQRNYGLAIEVSTRFENPIGNPYFQSKKENSLADDLDLVILAPKFTEGLRERFEKVTDERWHSEAEGEMVHLHRVPTDKPEVYRPFATEPIDFGSDIDEGFPVIVADSQRVRERIGRTGHVSENYPVVDSERRDFADMLDGVEREYRVIPESGYRTQLREGIEPLLHEFEKPYQIEQWLIDTYWDQGLTTNEVGDLAGVSGRTIRRWLSEQHWDIITRGTGTNFTDATLEIWRRMYNGDDPFPRQMTGYEIQALYNEHPFFDLEDWREWYQDTTDEERAQTMAQRQGPEDLVSYTILIGSDERLFPSYDFIIEQLRASGIEIREGFFNETGVVYPTATALEYMINRNINTVNLDGGADQRDVVTMRSSLEVDLAEWLSENEVPFAHEPFTIPSPFDTGGRPQSINDIIAQEPQDEVMSMWRKIHNKHNLGDYENLTPEETFDRIDRQTIVPDFATYPDADLDQKDANWIGWPEFADILEVSGAYGTPPPAGFESWYKFRSVAQKELAYKLLDLWNRTFFILTDDEGIPDEVRSDTNYIIINPSQLDSGMDDIRPLIVT